MENEFVYSRGVLSAEQVQSEIALFWHDLVTNPQTKSKVSAAGIDLDRLADIAKTGAITVRPLSSGVDTTFALLLVVFAPTANSVLKDLWSTVVLPRIRQRWGNDAIGKQRRSTADELDA